MSKSAIVSAKIPEDVYKEFVLRVSEGERSDFIRDAIVEKLQTIPRPDKLLELEKRVDKLEAEFYQTRNYLASLELLAKPGKINPYTFCIDELDHKIMDHILHYKSATTPEIADHLKTNRWLILNRLRRIQKLSKKQLGDPIVKYYSGEKSGKKKAWWLNEELIES